MTLSKLIEKQFGVATRPIVNPLIAATPGVAAVRLLPNNPDRLAWILINLSVNPMYINLTDAVSAINGIYVPPNGGFVGMVWDEDFQMLAWEWWVITPAGASNLLVIEIIEEYRETEAA